MTGTALQEWFTLAELLPHVGQSLPASMAGLAEHARKAGWSDDLRRCRLRPGKGGGREYHYGLLPGDVLARLILAQAPPPPDSREIEGRANALWTAFERAAPGSRLQAEQRLSAILAVREMPGTRAAAVAQVAALRGVSASALWSWLDRIKGVPRPDWLPALMPRHVGRTATAPCDPRAWDALKADYLRPEQRNFEACYRLMTEVAAVEGWTPIPSCKTLKRRMEREVPAAQLVMARQGAEAARKLYPAQKRDRSVFRALQAVNADGHKIDVMARWEDDTVGRPILHVIQDLYSGTILACRVDRTENKEAVRLALADMVSRYGIPEHAWLDNGRQFAAKSISGGQATRYRFKIRPEEPDGILKALGIEVHWTQPYSGQSKPIERAFRDFCEEVAKHPSFAGAYTGNSPLTKPANYGSRAVPIAEFEAVLKAEVERHNLRPGRRSAICAGKLSFRQALDASLADSGTLVTRATAAQRRMLLLAAESVTARTPDGAVHLMGNRYWSEALLDHVGQRLTVRFDPQNLAEPVAVYTLDNRLIGEAEPQGVVAFNDEGAARRHAHDRKSWLRGQRLQLEAEKRLGLDDYASLLPRIEPAPAPEPRAVRLIANGPPRPIVEDISEDFGRGVAWLEQSAVVPFARKEDGGAS